MLSNPRAREATVAILYRMHLSVGWVLVVAGGMGAAKVLKQAGHRDFSTLMVFSTMALLFVPGLIWRRSVYNEIARVMPAQPLPPLSTRLNPFGGHFRRLTQALSADGAQPAPRMFTMVPRLLLVLGVGAVALTGFLGAYYGSEADRDVTVPLYAALVGTGGVLLFISGNMTSFGVRFVERRFDARIDAAATSDEWNDALRPGQHRAE